MSDPTGEHPRTAEGKAREEEAPDSRLTRRLRARGARPLGVIDVRRAESHYARIMDWLATRTPLLEHLRARYGLAEGEGAVGLSLAFADARAGEGAREAAVDVGLPAFGGGVNLSAAPDAFAPRAAEGLVAYVAHVPDDSAEQQVAAKRITRRGVPVFSRAGSETQRPDAGARSGPDEAARQQRGGPAPTTPERVGPSLEPAGASPARGGSHVDAPRGSHAAPSVKEIPGASAGAHDAPAVGAPPTPRPPAASTAPPESTQPPTLRPAPPAEGRARASAAEPDGALDPALGRRDSPSVKEIPAAGTLAGSEKTLTSAGVSIPARPGASGAHRAPGADAPASGSPAHAASGVRETRAPAAPAEGPMPLARAREVADESQALRALPPLPLPLASNPGGPVRGEGASRHDGSAAADAARVPPAAAETFSPGGKGSGERAGAVNVERLTEQVSRHLARRLLVERERRGMSGR